MASDRPQTFANHTQWTPGFHFFASPLAAIFFVWAVRRVVQTPNTDTAFMLVGAVALLASTAMGRVQALKVQDRVIRLEERLRLMRILPADLQPHIPSLRASHLVAMRFASDEETPELMRYVLANATVKPKEIKQRIRNWQADWFRA
jgi:hypothetical protein